MVYIGLMGAGLVPAPASPAATPNELAAMIKLVQPFSVIVHPSCRKGLIAAMQQLPPEIRPTGLIGMTRDSKEDFGSVFDMVDAVRDGEVEAFVGLHGKKGKDTLALIPFSRCVRDSCIPHLLLTITSAELPVPSKVSCYRTQTSSRMSCN